MTLPTRFDNARYLALQSQFPETNPAELEPSDEAPGSPTDLTPVAHPNLVLTSLLAIRHTLLGHKLLPSLLTKRHSQQAQQTPALFVGLGRRHNGNLHPPDLVDLIVVDLRPEQLFPQTQSIIPTSVKGIR